MQEVTISNLTRLIKVLGLEIERFDMEKRRTDTYHELSHRFKEEIIIPMIALTNTYDFFIYCSATKHIITADGVECIAEGYEEKHICELEDDIKRLYNVDAWSFIKKWYNYDSMMTNMTFVKIWLKKDENRANR